MFCGLNCSFVVRMLMIMMTKVKTITMGNVYLGPLCFFSCFKTRLHNLLCHFCRLCKTQLKKIPSAVYMTGVSVVLFETILPDLNQTDVIQSAPPIFTRDFQHHDTLSFTKILVNMNMNTEQINVHKSPIC